MQIANSHDVRGTIRVHNCHAALFSVQNENRQNGRSPERRLVFNVYTRACIKRPTIESNDGDRILSVIGYLIGLRWIIGYAGVLYLYNKKYPQPFSLQCYFETRGSIRNL